MLNFCLRVSCGEVKAFPRHSSNIMPHLLCICTFQLYAYLEEKMATVAPNLSTLIGETVAARLIQKAGSLTSLAKCPASTVQILGAEKALFRCDSSSSTPLFMFHSAVPVCIRSASPSSCFALQSPQNER